MLVISRDEVADASQTSTQESIFLPMTRIIKINVVMGWMLEVRCSISAIFLTGPIITHQQTSVLLIVSIRWTVQPPKQKHPL